MSPKIDQINLGVADTARHFYEHALARVVHTDDRVLTVSLGPGASRLALRSWDSVACDAGVDSASSGFRCFTLSYILDSAAAVDDVLTRAERHGGRVSKPPKNALWDTAPTSPTPSGFLWKIASSKRRPLLGRGDTPAADGRTIRPREVPITIGVADMKLVNQF